MEKGCVYIILLKVKIFYFIFWASLTFTYILVKPYLWETCVLRSTNINIGILSVKVGISVV